MTPEQLPERPERQPYHLERPMPVDEWVRLDVDEARALFPTLFREGA